MMKTWDRPIAAWLRSVPAYGLLALLAACAAPEVAQKPIVLPVFPGAPDAPRFYYERTIYSSADVSKDERNGELKRLLTGEARSGEGMAKPYGVAAHKGRVFVSDSAMHAVVVYDIPGERYFKIGEDDAGRLISPLGLDVDAQGGVYVVDSSTKVVQVYDRDGRFKRSLGGPKYLTRPAGVAVDPKGEFVYVVDTGGVTEEGHRIVKFDAKSGDHVLNIGKRGSGPGELNLPRDVAVAPNGDLYVVDGANFRMQVFKSDGSFVKAFGGVGRRSGQFSRPKEVAVDKDGNMYVVDSAFGNFQIFNPEGQVLLGVGSRAEVDGMAKYMLPSGIAVDYDGRVYVVDQYFRKLDVYRPAQLAEGDGFAYKAPPKDAKDGKGGKDAKDGKDGKDGKGGKEAAPLAAAKPAADGK